MAGVAVAFERRSSAVFDLAQGGLCPAARGSAAAAWRRRCRQGVEPDGLEGKQGGPPAGRAIDGRS